MEEKIWVPDIKNWEKITKESADLIIRECELGLAGKIKSLESITSRSDKILAFYIPIFTASCVYVIPKYGLIFIDYLTTVVFFILIFSFIGLFFCGKNMRNYIVGDSGYYPNKLLKSEYIDNGYNEKSKYIALAIVIIRDIQRRMEWNDIEINKRSSNNKISLLIFLIIALSPAFSYFSICIENLWVCHFLH